MKKSIKYLIEESNKLLREKETKGITLIALIVTIIILIILATISINAVLGENGIIEKAQQAKELHENSVLKEEETLDTLVDEYDKVISGGNYTDKYIDDTLPVAPRLAGGMTKVKYNSTSGKMGKGNRRRSRVVQLCK